jgi:hypothetical protein
MSKPTKPTAALHPVMFRLSPEHIAALDTIGRELAERDRSPKSRTDALRHVLNTYLARRKP